MFFFYSNRLGCLASVALSLVLSLVLFGVLFLFSGGLATR